MKRKTNLITRIHLVLFSVLLISIPAMALTLDCTWTGAGDGTNWSDGGNWSCGVRPINQGEVVFNVTIPVNYNVTFDVAGDSEIQSLILGDSATTSAYTTASVIFNPDCNITVTDKNISSDETDIYEFIKGVGGDFTAIDTPNALGGDRVRIHASDGSQIAISDDTYSSKKIWRSWDASSAYSGDQSGTWDPIVLKASNEETVLDFAPITVFDANFYASGNDYNYQHVVIEDGAVMDFSGLETILAPRDNRSRIRFELSDPNSELRLDGLMSIVDSTVSSYYTHSSTVFTVNDSTLAIPSLSSAQQSYLGLSNAASLDLSSIVTMEDVQFNVSGGSVVHDGGGPATYSTLNIWRSWDASSAYSGDQTGTWEVNVLKSSGTDSLLDLSSVQTFDAGFNAIGNDYNYQHIVAENGGSIDLSSTQIINGPVWGMGRLKLFATGADSDIKLDSLTDIIGNYSGSYYRFSKVPFSLDSTVMSLPSLANAEQVSFGLSNAASLDLSSIVTMEDVQFNVSGGSVVHDGSGPATYSTLNIWRSWDASSAYSGDQTGTWEVNVLKSSGTDSLLDLSSVQTFNADFDPSGNDNNYQYVVAENAGVIDLSGMQTITGPNPTPTYYGKGRLQFSTTGSDSEIKLDSLMDAEKVTFALSDGSSLDIPSMATMEDIQFNVSGGSVVHDGSGPATYSTLNIWRSWDASSAYSGDQTGTWEVNVLKSSGTDSLLDLSSVETFNAGFNASGNDNNYQKVIAEDGGVIDLSGSYSIIGPPYYRGRLMMSSTGPGSDIKLDSLTDIIGNYSGSYYRFSKVPFSLDSTVMSLPSLANAEQVSFGLSNAASLDLSSIVTMEDVQFNVSGGSVVHDGSGPATYSTLNIWRSWDASSAYSGDQTGTWEVNVLKSSGTDSLLDLSSVETFNAGFNASGNDNNYQKVIAEDGGVIDLSGSYSIIGPPYYRGRLMMSSTGPGSDIKLDSLTDIIGNYSGSYYRFSKVPFSLDSTVMSLPSLANAEQVSFGLSNAASLDLSSIVTMEDVQFNVSGGSVVHDGGGPATYSTLNIWRSWDASSAYSGDQTGTWEVNVLKSSGTDSLLDLSSVESFDAGFNAAGNDHIYQKIIAENGSTIDFSSVQSIIAPHGSDDRLYINVTNDSLIDLSSVSTINSASAGRTYVSVTGESELLLGGVTLESVPTITLNGGSYLFAQGMQATTNTTITMNDSNDLIEIEHDFDLADTIRIINPGAGGLMVGGDFSFSYNGQDDEDLVQLDSSIVQFDGDSIQYVEIGGLNVGKDIDYFPELIENGNFGFGQMIVGCCDETTIVKLTDEFDNGNLAGGPHESLYLFGIDGSDGLRILNGSILVIPVPEMLYTLKDGEMIQLPGEPNVLIPYDEGFYYFGDFNPLEEMNGDFERGVNPPDPNSPLKRLPTGSVDLEAWTIDQDVCWGHDAYTNSRDGELCLDLGKGGEISQAILTEAGSSYRVIFDFCPNPLGYIAAAPEAKIVGVQVGSQYGEFSYGKALEPVNPDTITIDPNPKWKPGWSLAFWEFTADSDVTMIAFSCLEDPPTPYGPVIDNVRVLKISSGASAMSAAAEIPAVEGDFNGDLVVDQQDLVILLQNWLVPQRIPFDCSCINVDMNDDGIVNLMDWAIFSNIWNREE